MSLRVLAVLGAGVVSSVVLLAVVAAVGITAVFGGSATAFGTDARPSTGARSTIPHDYLMAFEAAAASCPGLPWNVLAGIGRVETDFGVDTRTSAAGAVGPMQFLPATFAQYDRPVPPGGSAPPDPYDPVDAVWAAARLLCDNGARDGADIPAAIYAYNHSAAYVREVLSYAASYVATARVLDAPSVAAAIALGYALDQLGTPYEWGGETPGIGFDCSGLTQAAYAAAGIAIPRTSEAQWTTVPHVPLADIEPGDLVFFEPGEFVPGLPGHVGIYLGHGEMVDAPHRGTDVRIDHLADWPAPMGAARPADLVTTSGARSPVPVRSLPGSLSNSPACPWSPWGRLEGPTARGRGWRDWRARRLLSCSRRCPWMLSQPRCPLSVWPRRSRSRASSRAPPATSCRPRSCCRS